MAQRFGGRWTQEKLEILEKYLKAYMAIMKGNDRARHFTTVYIDGFAGSGSVDIPVFGEEAAWAIKDEETGEFFWPLEGSASIALSLVPGFDRYEFVDLSKENLAQLNQIITDRGFDRSRVGLHNEDCNTFLTRWCTETDWSKTRAMVFLDPFATELHFQALECLGSTKGVDLWILFPLMAVNRMLSRTGDPATACQNRLDRVLGTPIWRETFYRRSDQPDLFTETAPLVKTIRPEGVTQFFIDRLKPHFDLVCEESMVLKNNIGTPLFSLVFASANPRGSRTAVKIAKDIIAKSLEK